MKTQKNQNSLYDFGIGLIATATGLITGQTLGGYIYDIPMSPFVPVTNSFLIIGLIMLWLARKSDTK